MNKNSPPKQRQPNFNPLQITLIQHENDKKKNIKKLNEK